MVFRHSAIAPVAVLLFALIGCSRSPQSAIQSQLNRGEGVVQLPDGLVELTTELRVPPNSRNVEIVGGKDTVLRAGTGFQGRALLLVHNTDGVKMRNFRIDGNRPELDRPSEVPPASAPYVNHFQGSGILIDDSKNIEISGISMRELSGFAVLASRVKKIRIERVTVDDSGGRTLAGRNNTTGGVLFEEGTDDFEIRDSVFRKILGNAIWTHSTYLSARNYRGVIANNRIELVGRDAIQIGSANRVRVEGNTAKMIGYPTGVVETADRMVPAGIRTTGKVDETAYVKNRLEEVNGICVDLNGFHDGEVSGNVCLNRGKPTDYPQGQYAVVMNNANKDMESQLITIRDNVFDGTRYGGIFVIGQNHKIINNKLLNLNTGHCNEGFAELPCVTVPGEPLQTQAGIYLASRGERSAPANMNVIEGNEISGYHMAANCVISAPSLVGVENTVRGNKCVNQ